MAWQDYPGAPVRYGNTIKIDDPADTAPPGQGPSWLSPYQPNLIFAYEPDYSNPASVFSYRLMLDGTSGVRAISAALYRYGGSAPPNASVLVWSEALGLPSRGFLLPTEQAPPLLISVVPSPAGATVFSAVAALGLRRARRCRRQ